MSQSCRAGAVENDRAHLGKGVGIDGVMMDFCRGVDRAKERDGGVDEEAVERR